MRVNVNSPRLAGCPVNVSAASASVTATLIVGKSLLLILPVPVPAVELTTPLVGLLNTTPKVSLSSEFRSPLTATLTILLVCPGEKVTVWLVMAW